MYSFVPSRPAGYLIKYDLFTTISELSDLDTKENIASFYQKAELLMEMQLMCRYINVIFNP